MRHCLAGMARKTHRLWKRVTACQCWRADRRSLKRAMEAPHGTDVLRQIPRPAARRAGLRRKASPSLAEGRGRAAEAQSEGARLAEAAARAGLFRPHYPQAIWRLRL